MRTRQCRKAVPWNRREQLDQKVANLVTSKSKHEIRGFAHRLHGASGEYDASGLVDDLLEPLGRVEQEVLQPSARSSASVLHGDHDPSVVPRVCEREQERLDLVESGYRGVSRGGASGSFGICRSVN